MYIYTYMYIYRMKDIAIEAFKSVKGLNTKYMNSIFSFSTMFYCTRDGSKIDLLTTVLWSGMTFRMV